MLKGSDSVRYYLFSLANLIAAFGGGIILGKGIGVINVPYIQGGSILAFFIGTVLGLVFLQSIPKEKATSFAKYFSVSCGITSLILLYIYKNYSHNHQIDGSAALIFFVFLSIRFGFWFYSRVMRASSAASSQQSIAWVEMGYYLGMVLGLVIWKLLNFNIELGTALILDGCLQFIAGMLDFKSNVITKNILSKSEEHMEPYLKAVIPSRNLRWCWKLSFAVIFLTMAIQVILFSASHNTSETVSSYIIATFYFGVAVAAFFCNMYKMNISWDKTNSLAYICSQTKDKKKIKLSFFLLMSFLSVALVITFIRLTQASSMDSFYFTPYIICLFVFISAFIFEVVSVVLLDRIGYEEQQLNYSGMIMRTYGLMGVGAAIGFWLLGVVENVFEYSIITLIGCFVFFSIYILKRKPFNENSVVYSINIEP